MKKALLLALIVATVVISCAYKTAKTMYSMNATYMESIEELEAELYD